VRLDENESGDKTSRYFERTHDGKLLLRKVMERHVPPHVTGQVKQGFSGPDASWFRGESLDYVRRVVDDPNARMYEFLDADTVRGVVEKNLSGREHRRARFCAL